MSAPAPGLADLIRDHRVVVCVGSGGVGKTTTSAAIAVYAAQQGRRVLCLTIDPAKRLAQSLGLGAMKTEEQEVPRALFVENGLDCRGSLAAMMLDTKGTFDDLVHKHASSPEVRDRILASALYRYISTSLAGTQEYMAMEKLHAVREDDRFDLVVLDTPPTSNALEFLNAPERLIGAIDSPAVRWFIQAFEGAGKLGFGVVGKGAQLMLKGLARFTGGEFLETIARFIVDLNDLFGGFRRRATEVRAALRSDDVAFVIVTSPSRFAAAEAVFLGKRLADTGISHDAVVVNRVHPPIAEVKSERGALEAALKAALPPQADADALLDRLSRAHADESARAVFDRREVDRLRARVGQEALFIEVPAFDQDIHDLRALARVAAHLFA